MNKYIYSFVVYLFICSQCQATPKESLERCEQYKEYIQNELKANDLNINYYYLMVAESRCTQKAKSNKGALGFWQLMPRTAKNYGCNTPQNLECSTRAAIGYLKHLNTYTKDFYVTIKMYNQGGHNYLKYGETNEAKALAQTVKRLIEVDK